MSDEPQLTHAQRSELCILAGRLSGMAIALKNGWADERRAAEECDNAHHQLLRFVQEPDQKGYAEALLRKAGGRHD